MESATNHQAQVPPLHGDVDKLPSGSKPAIAASAQPILRWFQAQTIEQRVLAGFSLVFVGILIISAMSYHNTSDLLRNSGLDGRSHELILLLGNIDAAMGEAEGSHRRYLVTGEQTYLDAYTRVIAQKPTFTTLLKDLTQDSPEQERRAAELDRLMERQVSVESKANAQVKERGLHSVRKMALEGAGRHELDGIHQIISEMDVYERQAVTRRVIASATGTRYTILLLAVGAVLQLVLLASVYYLIRHDVTERRRVAGELQRRGELLEAANKELEAFSYSVSHDLRAPLRHIDGYAALLRKAVDQSLNEKAARYLQTISDAAKQMGQLIDDLLVFSRMGRQEMLQATVNMDQLIQSILSDLRLDLQGRHVSWTIDSLPEVKGDPAMLRQVFMNLLTNALKFTSTKATASIEVGVESLSSGEAVLYIRDNGVGFDMQYAPKLFGVFQRLHRADEFEGTGIGLANVRRIVHRHGGRTWADAVPDKGATFYVALPRGETQL
ncbi:MAG: ATP-binding protein [Nitrospira sp.]|nr:ATP-binding protein [Nitrospira sp.]